MRTVVVALFLALALAGPAETLDPWGLARTHADTLRFSTLFTAQNVREYLRTEAGRDQAVAWCKDTGITQVFLESFRGGYLVPLSLMGPAVERFEREGFGVSGCITTVDIGRESVEGWIFPCFTEPGGLENLKHIFEYTAMQFDEIMIDDFFATRCVCPDCREAKGEASWAAFRTDWMVKVSKEYVLDPVRRVNPDCRLILKYPQWYPDFQDKGYDILRQTPMFHRIWVGTETRDPDREDWGRHPQYLAYFIMRWLGLQGGDRCGGGWFDPYGTSPDTYVEQARQTILGGARQALLFCYGALQKDTGPANVRAFRQELPELFRLAGQIKGKPIRGVHAPLPGNSEGAVDRYLYDFIGMLGVPLVPALGLDPDAPSAVLSHALLAEAGAAEKIEAYLQSGRPVLLTDTLAGRLPEPLRRTAEAAGVIWNVPADKWDWMDLDPGRLNAARNRLLQPLGVEFTAPSRVALYLFGDDLFVVENFNPTPAALELRLADGRALDSVLVVKREQEVMCRHHDGTNALTLPGRTLVVLQSRTGG